MRTLLSFFVLLLASAALAAPPAYDVRVLNPGQSPRTLYEYAPTAGSEESVSVRIEHDQKVAMSIMEREIILPIVTARADLVVDAAPPARTIGANVSVEELSVETRDGVPEGLVERMEQAYASLKPATGRLEASPAGHVTDFTLDTSTLPGSALGITEQLEGALQSLLVPLPETPIGEGAEWSVTTHIPTPQFTFTQTTTYTLYNVSAHRLAMRVTIEQSVPPDVVVRDVSGNWEGTISEFYGEGAGTIAISLKQLSPLHSELAIASRVIIEAELDGEKSRSAMANATKVKTEGKVVK